MGRSPTPGELDMLKRKASEMEQSDKIIPFPPGGKDKVDPFKDRPNVTRDADELKPGFGDNIRDAYRQKGASREDAAKMIEAMDSPGGREATKIFEKELGMKLYGDETFEEIMEIKRTGKHPRGEPKAKGGIIGLANGGPSDPGRRKFMKILGGLASIPVLGRFIKPVTEVAPVVAEGVKTVPSYFFKLVDKIKTLGDDAPGLTTVEREVGKRYKDYELVEDLSSGDIVVKKNKQGGVMMGDEMIEGTMQEEVMIYRPKKRAPEGDLPEDYEELTARPSSIDGKMDDVEKGLDSIDDVLEEVGEIRPKKKIGGIVNVLSVFKRLFKSKYKEFLIKNNRYPSNKERTKLIDDAEQEIKTNFPEEYAETPNPSQSFRTIKGSRVDKDMEADMERENMGFFPMTQEDEIRRVMEGGPGLNMGEFFEFKKALKRQDKAGGGIAYLLGE